MSTEAKKLWDGDQVRELLGHLFDRYDRMVPAAFVDPGSHQLITRAEGGQRQYRGFLLGPFGAELPGYSYWDGPGAPASSYDPIGDIRKVNVEHHYGVAIGVTSYGHAFEGGAIEKNVEAVKAFGIDVDTKNFWAISPSSDKREVIHEAIRQLEGRGIRPHLVVNSGSGFHLYFLIDRFQFESDEDRLRFKRVWYQLSGLWCRTDKFDLATRLRIPGTIHWKDGEAKPTGFIYALCDRNRPRYSFEHVANAVRHVPVDIEVSLKEETTKKTKGRKSKAVQLLASSAAELPVLVQLAIDQDAQLGKVLSKEITKTYTRSEQDFAVALRLIELGTPTQAVEQYLTQTPKALDHSKPEHYASQTLGNVLHQHESLFLPVTSIGCSVSEVLDFEAHINTKGTSRGEKNVATSTATTTPKIQVVMAAPGKGKSSGIIDWLARDDRSLIDKKIGFCGAFVSELLINEVNINARFPYGIIDDGNDFQIGPWGRWCPRIGSRRARADQAAATS